MEFLVLMKHCFLAKKNTFEGKAWLDKLYLDSAPAKSTVEKWFAKFKRGEMCIENRFTLYFTIIQNYFVDHKIILNDRKVKIDRDS
jgi:hypothetical protein